MEKRRYLALANADTSFDTITHVKRVIEDGKVEAYEIVKGGITTTLNLTTPYDLTFQPSGTAPSYFNGVVKERYNSKELWTADGIYLIASETEVMIKDALEFYDEKLQGDYYKELIRVDEDKMILSQILIDEANRILKNEIAPKEFFVANSDGYQEDIVAYTSSITYYVNSANDYYPYQNTTGQYNAQWVMTNEYYNTLLGGPGATINAHFGITKDMRIRGNKLVYLLSYDGITQQDIEMNLIPTNGVLFIGYHRDSSSKLYKVFINLKALYTEDGTIPESSYNTWNTIVIPNMFTNSEYVGKVIKVW